MTHPKKQPKGESASLSEVRKILEEIMSNKMPKVEDKKRRYGQPFYQDKCAYFMKLAAKALTHLKTKA